MVTRRYAIAMAVATAGCGDNLHPADAVSGAPDLALVASQMTGSTLVLDQTFAADDCAIAEGCIAQPGPRKLLVFDTVTENVGTADLVLGQVPPPGVSSGIFVWSPCHMHHHIIGYADYALLDGTGVVAAGHKQGFCLEDDEQVDPIGPSHHYSCNFQGLSIGWADVYDRALPCQWIDVTDVPTGDYTLQVTIDATGVLPDADPSNNVWMTAVAL
ncbi:MAG TPA: lysyl oxidase family protein [Kofleriaceae bacterium]